MHLIATNVPKMFPALKHPVYKKTPWLTQKAGQGMS